MFRRVDLIAMAAGLSLLAGCASGPSASPTSFDPSAGAQRNAPLRVRPDKGCAGTRRIAVAPCPVLLTSDTKDGIVVTVSGRHVVDSKLGRMRSCFNNENCYDVSRLGSSRTQWLFTSGRSCGDALIEMHAFNARGRAGVYYLELSNEYCP